LQAENGKTGHIAAHMNLLGSGPAQIRIAKLKEAEVFGSKPEKSSAKSNQLSSHLKT